MSKTDPNDHITDDGVNTYTWNERDELVSLRNKSTGAVASFSYDALGRRISKTIGGVTTGFVYSGSQVIEETTNGVTRRYLVGLGLDSVFASRTGTTNAQDEVYLKDALNGSVLAAVTTEANPRVKTGYGYTPFGQVTRYPSSWQQVGTGDFTLDGKIDILVSNYATGENALWRMNGTTYHSALTLKPESDRNWRSAAVGDFNQDGKADLVKHNEATGDNAIWLMQGTIYQGATPLPSTEDRNWRPVATGHFNSDGSTDIVMSNYDTGENALWLMSGTEFVSGVNLPSVGSDLNWRVIATGDFSLDGKVDLLLTNYATGQNAVWIMNGVTYSGNAATLPLDYEADWCSTTTGDFDQDGQPDIVKSNYATGENAIWLMDGFEYQGAGPLPTYTNFYTNPAASTNNLTFTGREEDGTGVLYYRARYYAPRLQRFLSEDPLGFSGGDSNLYRYVGNAPNTGSDPTGLIKPSTIYADDPDPIDTLPTIHVTAPRPRGSITILKGRVGEPRLSQSGRKKLACGPACAIPFASQMVVNSIAVALGLWLQRGGPVYLSTESEYKDVTEPRSIENRETDVTKEEFEKNLTESGYEKSVSKDGKSDIFTKDGDKYAVRDDAKSHQGPTAEYTRAGETRASLKIRLAPN